MRAPWRKALRPLEFAGPDFCRAHGDADNLNINCAPLSGNAAQ
jgi:hypothetical protein